MTDLILISNALTTQLKGVTLNAIRTAKRDDCMIWVVESNHDVTYPDSATIHPEAEFNYNRYLNIGARAGQNPYIFFANNDLTFHTGWATKMITAMKLMKVNSASAFDPNSHGQKQAGIRPNKGSRRGLTCGVEFAGWGFMWTRELWKRIGLNETYRFWCSDNEAVRQLQQAFESHILVTDVTIEHLGGGSKTLNHLDKETNNLYTEGDVKAWNRNTGENKFGWGI